MILNDLLFLPEVVLLDGGGAFDGFAIFDFLNQLILVGTKLADFGLDRVDFDFGLVELEGSFHVFIFLLHQHYLIFEVFDFVFLLFHEGVCDFVFLGGGVFVREGGAEGVGLQLLDDFGVGGEEVLSAQHK